MNRLHRNTWMILILLLGLVATWLAGCSPLASVEATAGTPAYAGALDTSYENALDPTSQLALGTLRLEGTADAVTQEQAARLLPLWQALVGTELKGSAERTAVVRQIEATMSEAQVSTIAAMHLTAEDASAGTGQFGPGPAAEGRQWPGGGQSPGDQMPRGTPSGISQDQSTRMREQFQNMSPEELATRRAQFGGARNPQGGTGRMMSTAAGGASAWLTRAVITLLTERSGQTVARDIPVAATPSATTTPLPSRVRPTSTPSPTVEATPTATPIPTVSPTVAPTSTPQPVPSVTPTGVTTKAPASGSVATPTHTPTPAAIPLPALTQIEDTNPGPPFTIQVSANTATQDPLVEKSRTYRITGIVRNDGNQTYDVSALHVTFYDASGFRGTFNKYPRVPGGEWEWHGQTEAEFDALLLAPGEEWPFTIEITAQDMASFLIHPDATATERQSVPVQLTGVKLIDDGAGYVRIRGAASNGNSFKVKNIVVSAALLDASGQIVSVGSTYVVQTGIEPGASVSFEVRVAKQPYTRYQLYTQAEQDG